MAEDWTVKPRTVVITDDDGTLRRLVHLVLEKSPSFTVVAEASDADSCVSATTTLQPDVVLLDLGLPGMNGLDAIPVLKQVAPSTSVIVLSSQTRERLGEEAFARGADGYLEKGNLVTDLVATLTQALEARSA
jgi:DNA-binding NarL/FixJ family response regulator